jgi:hypothetical protein
VRAGSTITVVCQTRQYSASSHSTFLSLGKPPRSPIDKNIFFPSQTLLEHAAVGQDLERLGTIEVSFSRGAKSNVRPWDGIAEERIANLGGPIGEKASKKLMVGCVTQ